MKSQNLFTSIDEAVEMLSGGIVDITFVKKTNGQIRTMHSTLHKPYIPLEEYKTVDSIIANSIMTDGSIPLVVWDLYKSDWRSFYINSTIEIQESLIFGDTTVMAEEMIQEKVSEDTGILTTNNLNEIISNITDVIKGRVEDAKKDIPERIAEFTVSEITRIVTNAVKSLKFKGSRR
tara:strand:- start:21 stop:551 length:531 start_codon:yes stop_codon:yes gene_type:complete